MQSLDILFRRFVEEMKVKGANDKQLKRYVLIYQCFRSILPDISIEHININTVLYFYEKLRIRLRKADYLLSNTYYADGALPQKGIKAILVYPMNALINSQGEFTMIGKTVSLPGHFNNSGWS